MMGRVVLYLVLLTGLTATYAQPPCALIMPSVLHAEMEETIVVDAHLQNAPFQAQIIIQDFPQRTLVISKATVNLNSGNGFLDKAHVKVEARHFPQDSASNQYVSVTVQSDRCNLHKVVLLSFRTGYIFIQTDKPIYKPGTAVLFRVFVTGLSMEPDTRTVDVEIKNPDGIVVMKNQYSSSDKSVIIQKSYNLPEIANEGKWQIACKFQVAPQEVFGTEFEVKEYVLPSFEVLLNTPQNYYYLDDNDFKVDITARFLHGKPVEGFVDVMFGVIVNNVKISFIDSKAKIKVTNGKAEAKLERYMISTRYPNPEFLLGRPLYVTVLVTTNAGSDLVTAEKTDIPIVQTAFNILFTKSSKYFKPGLPYIVNILLQRPDRTVASNVEICTLDMCTTTNAGGEVQFVQNTQPNIQELNIHVRTKAVNIPDHRQTSATWTVRAYKSQQGSQNYLHISVPESKVRIGDTVSIHFRVQTKNLNIQKSFRSITYMILSKGQVIKMDQQPRDPEQTLTVVSLVVTEKFMPSFRIVAYYTVPGNDKEIVSDSLWVDMEKSCIRKLEFFPDPNRAVVDPQPGTVVQMKITGEPGASVGLVAVDKAVFVLNRKNIMSQDKVWELVEKSDLGCSPGGGMDNAGVFRDAGLSVESNIGLTVPTRSGLSCEEPSRRKRSPSPAEKDEKVKEYKESHLQKCCKDGMLPKPMNYSCQSRSQFILEGGECARVFLECCVFVFEPQIPVKRKLIRRPTMKFFHQASVVTDTAASEKGPDDDLYETMENINSRSIFYESWLWKVEILPTRADSNGFSSKVVNANLPESITTWEFSAISISPKSGICVAKPYEILVKKIFFIDLRLPYSVVRNEQVEIRAVLYSYVPEQIEVRVDLTYNEKMCSAATAEANFRQIVTLEPNAALVIPFVIVPLEIGNIKIEVKASVKDYFLTDGVVKHLKVVPEGMKIIKSIQSVILEPLRSGGGIQEIVIDTVPPNDIVPNTDPETYISVKGGLLGETLDNSIDGAKLKHLITVPSGCGEQNMMSMTPTVIATQYLDITNQWEKIGVERREEAITNINLGYTQQLVFRKPDNSYSAFTNRPASTWLTAYVVKVFSMAYNLIHIDKDVLCGAVHWLLKERQLPNGVFKEEAPVIHGEMVGGTGNTEPDASLTAFVLIALAEAKRFCNDKVPDLESGMTKSATYLENRMKTMKKPYTICITSYALSLVDKLPDSSALMRSSTDGTHWDDYSSDLYMIEATSYALLAYLKLQLYPSAEPVARWLIEQRFYGGGYGSTQATIMVFQAMSEYQIHVPQMNEADMDVSLSLPGRQAGLTWKIHTESIMLQRSEKVTLKDKIKVTAKGKGTGTLTVMSIYYTPLAEGTVPCKNFEFSVTLEEAPKGSEKIGALKTMFLNIYMRYLGDSDSTMTILDLTLLTGFTPDTDDLDKLTNHVDKYISKYEMDTERSERGALIIYLDKVSKSESQHLKFKIHQNFEVGILQPATVTIYEYYALENRCTKFYHPTENEGELRKICKDAECHCISERCNLKNAHKGKLDAAERVKLACLPGVDYVYECKLKNIEKTGAYDIFTMEVTRIIKLGSDEVKDGEKRRFYIHKSCRDSVQVTVGHTYLIWGRSDDIWEMKNEKSYVINGGTWYESIPTAAECTTIKTAECEEIYKFIDDLRLFGCSN
ncbi:complement C3-like isoform X2 [Engystomops pustulosus]|uniref:complement C3-like isoform X2 n=1 Tax=Engystomops pustulosus TaxID=76066 RepID=UPI003AFA1446